MAGEMRPRESNVRWKTDGQRSADHDPDDGKTLTVGVKAPQLTDRSPKFCSHQKPEAGLSCVADYTADSTPPLNTPPAHITRRFFTRRLSVV